MERAVRRRSVRALRRLLAPRPRSGRRAPVPMLRPRRIWTVAAIALLVLSEVQLVAGASSVPAAANPIAAENQKPGRPLQSPAAFQSLKNTFSHGETRFPNSTPSGASPAAPEGVLLGNRVSPWLKVFFRDWKAAGLWSGRPGFWFSAAIGLAAAGTLDAPATSWTSERTSKAMAATVQIRLGRSIGTGARRPDRGRGASSRRRARTLRRRTARSMRSHSLAGPRTGHHHATPPARYVATAAFLWVPTTSPAGDK